MKSPPPHKEKLHPVTFECQDLTTLVLLLRCAEEEIILKSLAAIMKYAEKCDKNKVDVKASGALECILPLLNKESRTIVKYATMNCAVLATSAEGRSEMRRLQFIPALLELLNHDSEVSICEYTTLTLAQLVADYPGRHAIIKMSGVPRIIKMLSVPDPDVQRNSAETLNILLKDVKAVKVLEANGGIQALLELLKSDFDPICHLALQCLIQTTERSKNFKPLISCGGLLVLLITLETRADLQAETLHILLNCLDDPECEQILCNNGFINIIIDLIAIKNQPADRMETKLLTIRSLYKLVRSAKAVKLLRREELDIILVECIHCDIAAIQAAAAQVIAIIAEYRQWRLALEQSGGLEYLIKLLGSSDKSVQLACITAVSNLVYASNKNNKEVQIHGGITPLVECLFSSNVELQAAAATCLANVATDKACREDAIQLNVMAGFMNCLRTRDMTVQINTCAAIAAFVCDSDARNQLLSIGLLPLVRLLSVSKPEVYLKALWIISTIGIYPDVAVAMCEHGIINFLAEHVKWGHRGNYADVIMDRILTTHLPAKYGYTGKLLPQDHIYDTFYDTGPWPWQQRFPGLEELSIAPVNHKCPILLVNFQHRPSLMGPDGGRSQTNSEEELSEFPPVFIATRDPAFTQYLEEVREKINPLATIHRQIVSLAEFVSEKMGGKFTMEEVHKFNNDLELSSLKCKYSSNVIPIGSIKRSLFRPRALMYKVYGVPCYAGLTCKGMFAGFYSKIIGMTRKGVPDIMIMDSILKSKKVLADNIGVPCSLIRGSLLRVWNEVMLTPKHPMEEPGLTTTETSVVDLVINPGRLLPVDSVQAREYCHVL